MTKPSEHWTEIQGGVTTPLKYQAAAISAGIKPGSTKKDLAILFSESASLSAALFTQNRVAAAPVLVSRRLLAEARGSVRALIVNSGNANACTGRRGIRDAESMARLTADALKIPAGSALVASTGVIGVTLPMDRIMRGIPAVLEKLSNQGGSDFSEAILTTDTRKKSCVVQSSVGGRMVTIAGDGRAHVWDDSAPAGDDVGFCYYGCKPVASALEESVAPCREGIIQPGHR